MLILELFWDIYADCFQLFLFLSLRTCELFYSFLLYFCSAFNQYCLIFKLSNLSQEHVFNEIYLIPRIYFPIVFIHILYIFYDASGFVIGLLQEVLGNLDLLETLFDCSGQLLVSKLFKFWAEKFLFCLRYFAMGLYMPVQNVGKIKKPKVNKSSINQIFNTDKSFTVFLHHQAKQAR